MMQLLRKVGFHLHTDMSEKIKGKRNGYGESRMAIVVMMNGDRANDTTQ
jgi:hypothetical protein